MVVQIFVLSAPRMRLIASVSVLFRLDNVNARAPWWNRPSRAYSRHRSPASQTYAAIPYFCSSDCAGSGSCVHPQTASVNRATVCLPGNDTKPLQQTNKRPALAIRPPFSPTGQPILDAFAPVVPQSIPSCHHCSASRAIVITLSALMK